MDYSRLGYSGLEVSRICLGCLSYGFPGRSNHPWILNEEQSRPFIKRALELGINFFDTANVYADGTSEEIVGRALKDFAKRDEVVIATKVNGRMRPGPNGAGLSRKAIMTEIDHSLRRLGTDYIDLYQIHRWDYETPIEETMEALDGGDVKSFIQTDKDFHIYLVELSGNSRLLQLMKNISDQLRWFGISALNLPDRSEQILQEHARIIECIEKRDVECAKQAILEHIEHTRIAILSSLTQ